MKKNVIISVLAIALAVLTGITVNMNKELNSALAEADYYESNYNECSNAYAEMELNYYEACGQKAALQAQFDAGKELAKQYVVDSLRNGSTASMPVSIGELEDAGFVNVEELESIWR